jgi:hypothetical protein
LRHGKTADGQFLKCCWDRVNGETAFMYVLGAGAADGRALDTASWSALRPFEGLAGGLRFNNADLGLFVFQYGFDLLDMSRWQAPGTTDLFGDAILATRANRQVCRDHADRFATYRRFWGLSAGDGPAQEPGLINVGAYRCYAPGGPIDGTAHITATLASVAHSPDDVLDNVTAALTDPHLPLRGRYGFSPVNVDRGWVGQDMVGIDAGAAVLALDNFLMADRVRTIFHDLPCVRRGLERLGFRALTAAGLPRSEPSRAA